MLTAVLLSVATAFNVAPAAYRPAAPAAQYQPAAFAAMPTAYSAMPANAAPQFVAQPLPVSRGAKVGAFDACAIFGLSAVLGYGASRAALAVKGPAKVAPKGPLGGSGGPDEGWVGDRGRSLQVQKFEAGSDYLFFQGPSPQYAVQDDLPSFFSAENFADMKIKPLQIVVTVVGFGTFGLLGYLLFVQ